MNMLRHAHAGLELMSAVAAAVKDERWGDAERKLRELKPALDVLTEAINDKVRHEISAPSPDDRDRG
jgi:hypothetical protein